MARIAIIGSGISGMGSAYLLHQAGHAITVYEKNTVSGGHTRTREVVANGKIIPVDTGFIVYNIPNYPHLSAMFKHLNVAVKKSDMSLAVTVDDGKFEWGACSLNAVFGQRRNLFNPKFYGMIREVMRFNREALPAVEKSPSLSLGELLDTLKLSENFRRYYLIPMGGAIWSCPPSAMLDFPAATFVQFFKNHGLLSFNGQHQWYTVEGGSREYMAKLTASYREHIRTGCSVAKVSRTNDAVAVTDSAGHTEQYDRVVFASHADETLAMLTDATERERTILGAFAYQRNMAYLHSDAAQMPKQRRCWASWVYSANNAGSEPSIGVTYWMNRLQSIDEATPLFVTLNPTKPIAPELIHDRHEFHHPIFTREAIAAQAQLPEIQGQNRSWFCGAYTRYGFHEDGLLSAVNVAKSMGATIPWL